jgi:hypothetical protein
MSRLMSVAFTEKQVRNRTKTVTRRAGWKHAKVGDRLTLCRKVMGRKPTEPLVRITEVQIVDIRRERLRAMVDDLDYGFAETTLEGFPEGTPEHFPSEFIRKYFTDAQRMTLDDEVTRIEWRYLDDEGSAA